MPSITDFINSAVPAGMTVAQYFAGRNSLNNATNTVTNGVNNASSGLNSANAAAIAAQNAALNTQRGISTQAQGNTNAAANMATIAQQQALAQQQGIYNTTLTSNAPYQQTGLTGNSQLQSLIANPNSLENTPGYQFELSQGLQGGQRAAAASGAIGNGGTIKSQTRYALDYANTKYNDAVNRLLQVTNVGQTANAANQQAGNTFGAQVGTEANNVGNIATNAASQNNSTLQTLGTQTGQNATAVGSLGVNNAENQAGLTLAQAELAANNQVAQGQNTSNLIKGIAPTIAQAAKAFIPGLAGAGAATAASATAAGMAPTVASLGAEAFGPAAESFGAVGTGTASSGALAGISSLLTNPITIGIGAAIAGALIWKSTQVHPTANTFVQNFQNPFGEHLGSVVDAFDQSLASGQMTKPQAQAAYDQTASLIQSFEQDRQSFAAKGSKESKVAQQAEAEMVKDFGPNYEGILGKMQSEIAQLPDLAAA